MKYYNRNIEEVIKENIKEFPVVVITGPRQSGKTTTLINLFRSEYKYISFDDIENEKFFLEDPKRFMQLYNNKIIFDEVQYVPDIFRYIKIEVDKRRNKYGNFILTGSSNFLMNKHISETLAGRASSINILPFSFNEIPKQFIDISLIKGGYPENVINFYRNWKRWYSNYINLYLLREVKLLSNIGDTSSFKDFIKLLTIRVSKILNLSDLSRDLGVAVNTIKKWISLLEASYITFRINPYYKNLGKRIVKSPKIYFYDNGIITSMLNITNFEQFERGLLKGELFENYIVSELMKKNINYEMNFSLYFYRTNNQDEIDLIVEKSGKVDLIEIKSSLIFRPLFIKAFDKFKEKVNRKFIVYRGSNLGNSGNIFIQNYKSFLKNYKI